MRSALGPGVRLRNYLLWNDALLRGDRTAAAPVRRAIRVSRSLSLDVGRLDDRPPLLNLGLLLRGKRGRRLFLARPDFLTHGANVVDAWRQCTVRHQRYWLKILHHVERERVGRSVDDMRLPVAEDDRVAIGRRTRDAAGADGAARPARVLNARLRCAMREFRAARFAFAIWVPAFKGSAVRQHLASPSQLLHPELVHAGEGVG